MDPALRQRVTSGLVLALGALLVTFVGGWLFVVMLMGAAVIMAIEWSRLAGGGLSATPAAVAAVAAPPVAALAALGAIGPLPAVAVLCAGATLLAVLARAFGLRPLATLAGGLYVGVPALALVWLRDHAPGGLPHLVWLLAVIWATDTFAYLVGRSVGGPRLAPSISPGKTWSGLLGGVMGASLLGGLAAQVLGAGGWLAAAIGGSLAIVGQIGDLFESALKRRAGVKDSGQLIPGHGGLLDRVDGLIFAAPVFAAVIWLGLGAGAAP